jgi:hypothetical protein
MNIKLIHLDHALKETFDDDLTRNIGSGGCGIFAEHLYDYLVSQGFKPKLSVLTTDEKYIESNIKNNEVPFKDKEHVAVCVDGFYIDASGVKPADEFCRDWSDVDLWYDGNGRVEFDCIDTLRKWNITPNCWNTTFDREKNIPVIENFFKHLIV